MASAGATIEELRQAGFQDSEIDQWKSETRGQLQDAGFSQREIDSYFGVKKEPDLTRVKETFQANFDKRRGQQQPTTQQQDGQGEVSQEAQPQAPQVEEADSFLDALEAGWDISVSGLAIQRKSPDVVLKENAGMFYRIASQVGTLAGDLPAMIAGAAGGGAVGGAAGAAAGTVALPVVGTVGLGAAGTAVGAGAGAFALPEAMRGVMMEMYDNDDVESFSDFWEKSSAIFIETMKAGTIGAATAGVGGVAGKVLKGVAAPAAVKTTAQLTSEVATMTTVGAALEGHAPEPVHFLEAAIVVGGLKGATSVAGKMRKIYARTGKLPAEVATEVSNNPAAKQKLLSENGKPEQVAEMITGEKAAPQPKPPERIEVTPKLPEGKVTNPELSPEVNKILEKVTEKQGPKSEPITKENFKEVAGTKANEVYTAVVDKLDPINQATKMLSENVKELPADKNPYILSRMVNDYKAKAKHFFEKGTIDFKTRENQGGSLRSILEKAENLQELDAFLISRRAIEKSEQGFKTGFDVEAAKAVVKNGEAKYKAVAEEVTNFSNQVLKYVEDSGVISKEAAAKMREMNKNYVPFKRIIEAQDGAKVGKGGKAGSLKGFKGSELEIQSPITSIIENSVELIRMAETNRPITRLLELAEGVEGQTLIEKVKTPIEKVNLGQKEVAAMLKKSGLDPAMAEPLTTFRAQQRQLAPNEFQLYRNGKREVYRTTPELAEAINKLGGDVGSTNTMFRIMRGITQFKKFGITFTPDFILRNLIRDKLTAGVFSQSKGLSPMDLVGAMGDLVKRNDTYYNWLKSGGANGAFLELNKSYIETNVKQLQRQTNFMGSVRNLVQKPVDAMRVAAELSEQSLRLAEFKKVTRKGLDPNTLTEGGFASREITIDFQRVGAKVSALNSITAFLNVSIQGLDRTARAVGQDPVGVTTKAAAYITAPSVLLWWANKDDERVKEIPRWEKDMFWIIPTDNWVDAQKGEADGLPDYMKRSVNGKTQINKGNIYRIPKPMELGVVFGSLPERVLESYFSDNPKAFKEFEDTMLKSVTPSVIPDAVAPAIEQYFNKSFFTGNDIVPYHMKDIMPEYQFVEYTSETAKTLGKMVATVDKQNQLASPMVLDNYIRSWGGSLGQYALQLADQALKKAGVAEDIPEATPTLSDIPFVKAFAVRFPRAGSASIQDFYDNYDETNKVVKTIKYLAKQGDFENVQKEMELKENQQKFVSLDNVQKSLSNQSRFIKMIHKNPDMSPDEKRQMIDGVYLMMIETAKQGNMVVDELKKATEDSK